MILRLCMLLLMLTCIFSVDYRKQIDAKKNELETVYQKLQRQRQNVSRTDRKAREVLKGIRSIEKILAVQNRRLRKINANIDRITLEINEISSELKKENHRFNKLLNVLKSKYYTYYKLNDSNFMELILDSDQITNYLSKMYFLEQVVSQDLNFLEELKEKNEQLQITEDVLNNKLNILEEKKQVISRLKGEIERNKKEKRRLYRRLQSQKKAYQKKVQELEKDSKEIEKMILRLQQSSKNFGKIGDGRYVWPVIGRISSSYGWRKHPIFKVRSFHSGLDIAAPKGRPVFAADDGVVIYTGTWGKYGKTVILDHGNKTTTLYAHMSAFYVKRSTRVTQGQVMGLVGETGWATGPHLHFEIRVNGKHHNPILYLPKR